MARTNAVRLLAVFGLTCTSMAFAQSGTAALPYRNAALSVDARVADLLGRMTLEEKVGQLLMLDARAEDLSFINARQPGALLHILGAKVGRAMDLAAKNRLAIPLLIGEDGIHGHSFWKGANIFPTQLAMAASWNPELLERVGRVTAEEMAPTGIHETFSPVLCLTRDLRWGRTGETFGEDPYLIGELGAALIRGYQGQGLDDPTAVLATAKHYAGYSETQGGRDASEADISRRKLRSYFLPPFERAARAGAMMFMTGYQSMDGVPSTANKWLLTDVLKDEWGFKGVMVTDWDNVGRLVHEQKVAATHADAAIMALRAGNDLMMTTPQFYEGAIEAVKSGRLKESEVDAPVKRLLALKFRMGLFENPRRPDLVKAAEVIARPAHRAAVLDAARQSLVLLQNDGLLPLDAAKVKSIAVIGPNADDDLQQLGDWSLGSPQHPPEAGKHPREKTVTVLDGIKAVAPQGTTVRYEKGCSINKADLAGLPAAVAAAEASDVIVAVVGDHLDFIGEEKSTATLEMQGGQTALLDALARTGKPMIVVLVNSKPLVLPASVKAARAILEAFNPGMEGGRAVAEAVFGRLNPSGKLTISFPVHAGQQPVFYNQVRGQHGNRYADLTQEPLFPFGHGLSYTTYQYSNARLASPTLASGQAATMSVDVENTGTRAGDEIVQVYVSDVVTSVTWVNKALKGFARVHLEPAEKKTVSVSLPWESFQLVDADGRRVVEPGDFEVLVGPSSRDKDLLKVPLRAAFTTPVVQATGDPSEGTWDLDAAASTFNPGPVRTHDTRTYTIDGDRIRLTGRVVYADGRAEDIRFDAALDGHDYAPTGNPRVGTLAQVRVDAYTIKTTSKRDGKVTATSTRQVSQDGKTLTITTTGTDEKGVPFNNTLVFRKRETR